MCVCTSSHTRRLTHSFAYTYEHTQTHSNIVTLFLTLTRLLHTYTQAHTLPHSPTQILSHTHTCARARAHTHIHTPSRFSPLKHAPAPAPRRLGACGGGSAPRLGARLPASVLQRPVPAESPASCLFKHVQGLGSFQHFLGQQGREAGRGMERKAGSLLPSGSGRRGSGGEPGDQCVHVVPPPGVPADREAGAVVSGCPRAQSQWDLPGRVSASPQTALHPLTSPSPPGQLAARGQAAPEVF